MRQGNEEGIIAVQNSQNIQKDRLCQLYNEIVSYKTCNKQSKSGKFQAFQRMKKHFK